MRVGPIGRWWARRSQAVDLRRGWHAEWPLLGGLTLAGLRTTLRQQNLHDTDGLPIDPERPRPEPQPGPPERWRHARSVDGSHNDLDFPCMGMAGARFGRNVPVEDTAVDHDRILVPNPRDVSLRLLTREQFIPATTLNLLAACWLQFMVHDWLKHGSNQRSNPWLGPVEDADPWPDHPMGIRRTRHA